MLADRLAETVDIASLGTESTQQFAAPYLNDKFQVGLKHSVRGAYM